VENTRYARVFHSRQWSNYNITGKCEVPKVENGTLQSGFHVGSFVNHGNRLDYRCAEGFSNQTDDKPRCDNGTWTSTPLCAPGQISQ